MPTLAEITANAEALDKAANEFADFHAAQTRSDDAMNDKLLAVADFFLANADPDDTITHLKLQKMCAYAQAFSLALRGKTLFGDALEAWPHGPVVRRLYEEFRANGKSPITTETSAEDSRLPFDEEELYVLETVNSYYGAYAPPRLRNMSHADFPGDFGNPARPVISNEDVRRRFDQHKAIRAIREALA